MGQESNKVTREILLTIYPGIVIKSGILENLY